MNIRIMPLLTIMTLLLSGVALAQDPQVSSANPSSALQGAIGLDVDITGANFEVGAAVKFFVSGSKKTGGVTVTNVVVHDDQSLTATVDVAPDATVSSFDIEVRLSKGRTGKGTDLFAIEQNDNANGGQGSNTSGIVTFQTQLITYPDTNLGVFSDKIDSNNHRYVSFELDGAPDPDPLGGTLSGDCATVVVPTDDGQDQGKAQLFVRNEDGECPESRYLLVRGVDLNGDEVIDDELVHRKLMCGDTFSNDTVPGESATVLCTLSLEKMIDGRVSRDGRIEWTTASVLHESDDVRVVTAEFADIYRYEGYENGSPNRKKKVIQIGDRVQLWLKVEFHRIRN